MTDTCKVTEPELCRFIIEWMRCDGWDVYEEVRSGYGEHRADIVGIRRGISHIVEVKLALSLSVLAQALNWRENSHFVSVAVPRTSKQNKPYSRDRAREFAHTICKDYGIGLLEFDTRTGWNNDIRSVIRPTLNRHVERNNHWNQWVGDIVSPMHNEMGRAGTSKYYYTPFRETCNSLVEVVRDHPDGIAFKDAVDIIKTDWHYRSEQSGRCSLAKFLERGGSKVFPQIDATMRGRSIMLRYIDKGADHE